MAFQKLIGLREPHQRILGQLVEPHLQGRNHRSAEIAVVERCGDFIEAPQTCGEISCPVIGCIEQRRDFFLGTQPRSTISALDQRGWAKIEAFYSAINSLVRAKALCKFEHHQSTE